MIKYEARVTAIGPLTNEFIEAGILVLFGEDAPEELVEFSIIHDGKELDGEVAAGDNILIGDEAFNVLAVGEVANSNLSNLGHFILKFNGESEVEMPGDICVEAKPIPAIALGTHIRVESNN